MPNVLFCYAPFLLPACLVAKDCLKSKPFKTFLTRGNRQLYFTVRAGGEPHRGQLGRGLRVDHRSQVCAPRTHLHVGPQVSYKI